MAWTDSLFGGMGGGVGNMVNSFLNPGEGYEDAARKMEEYWRKAQGAQEPYRQAGVDQQGRLVGAEDKLLDPSSLLADWMSKYQMSPYAQKSLGNARESGLNAASSMGLMGSSAAVNNIQTSASDVMNKDRSEYLNNLMNKFLAGVGIGQNIYNQGARTAENMGNEDMLAGEELGKAAYGAKNAPGDQLMRMMMMAAQAAGAYGGGGF